VCKYNISYEYRVLMDKEELDWDQMGFVMASPNRRKVVIILNASYATPVQIAKKTGIPIGHISNILSGLLKKRIVICKNPEAKRGRIYILTSNGKKIANALQTIEKIDDK